MSVVSTQAALDAIIAKGKAGQITPDKYSAEEAAVYTKELALYKAYTTAVAEVTKNVGDIGATTTRIAELQEKKQNAETNKSFTPEEQAELDMLVKKRQQIVASLDAVATPKAAEAQQLSDDLRKAQLAAIKPSGQPGQLTYIKPENLAEFIIRTQAINPYSRQRECDTRFLKILALSGEQANTMSKEVLQTIKTLIKDRILSS